MIDGAVDFLRHSASEFECPTLLKYSVLHFSMGLELLLKARLAREDPKLVFRDKDKFDHAGFRTGELQSVSLLEAYDRLQDLGVEFPKEAVETFRELGRLRNKYAHFVSTESPGQVALTFLEAMGLVRGVFSEVGPGPRLSNRQRQRLDEAGDAVSSFVRRFSSGQGCVPVSNLTDFFNGGAPTQG